MKNQKLTESSLIATIDHKKHNAIGYEDGELSSDRERLLNRYHGFDYGNEVEGRSSVKTREVFEAIEWVMPSLMRTFAGSEKVAMFDPLSTEDEQQADLETEYVNHIFFKDNPGYEILHTWFKDALLQRNGTIRIYYDESEDVSKEDYSGLAPEQVQMVGMDTSLEITNATQDEDGSYSITLLKKNKTGKVRIENVPPEEFLVSKDLRSIAYNTDRNCDFVMQRLRTTPSQLIDQGFKKKIVLELDSGDDGHYNTEAVNRRQLEDENPDHDSDTTDPLMRELWVDDVYIRIDWDGDDFAELRHVFKCGNTILLNEEVDEIPYETITPIIMGHKWVGLGIADSVIDLQDQSTALRRQLMDNAYNVNNARVAANEDTVNLDDLLTPVIGGVIRVEGDPVNAITPFNVPPIIQNVVPALDIIKNEFYTRTGIAPGISADSAILQETTAGAFNQAAEDRQQRIEMIIRNFAEGVKRVMLHIHRLVLQNQDYARSIKTQNQWVPVDPREWSQRDNMSINVGIGTGSKDSHLQKLMPLIADQKEHLLQGSPLVTPMNLFNSYEEVIKAAELKDVNRFYTNPSSPEAQQMMANKQDKKDPQEMAVEGQLQIEQQRLQLQAQKQQSEDMAKKFELQIKQREVHFKELESKAKIEIELAKLEQDGEAAKVEIERIKGEYKLQCEQIKEENKRTIELMKAELNRVTEIEKKAMEVDQKIEEAKASAKAESNKPKSKTVEGQVGDRQFKAQVKDN